MLGVGNSHCIWLSCDTSGREGCARRSDEKIAPACGHWVLPHPLHPEKAVVGSWHGKHGRSTWDNQAHLGHSRPGRSGPGVPHQGDQHGRGARLGPDCRPWLHACFGAAYSGSRHTGFSTGAATVGWAASPPRSGSRTPSGRFASRLAGGSVRSPFRLAGATAGSAWGLLGVSGRLASRASRPTGGFAFGFSGASGRVALGVLDTTG